MRSLGDTAKVKNLFVKLTPESRALQAAITATKNKPESPAPKAKSKMRAKAKAKTTGPVVENAPLPSVHEDGTVMLVEDIMGTVMHYVKHVENPPKELLSKLTAMCVELALERSVKFVDKPALVQIRDDPRLVYHMDPSAAASMVEKDPPVVKVLRAWTALRRYIKVFVMTVHRNSISVLT